MSFITSVILKRFLEQDKRKFEGLFPELVKRLILSDSQSISEIRMPSLDDVWAPGFDGIVYSQEQTAYVAAGKSVWELGTNADSLSKINDDYEKRTKNSLGIDKSETTFYLVIPRIWAYDNQGMPISQWESEHKDGWRNVHVYDASVLCDWINSNPVVCAWLFEQYGEGKQLSFSSVTGAWERYSNYTNPPLTSSMFLDGRQDEVSVFQENYAQKMCRVKSDTFLDAYGFCLSVLMQDHETANQVIVVNSESAYFELARSFRGKVFLLSFPFSGQVSDENCTILCYSKEAPSSSNMIELPVLWKSQFTNALCEMGLSDVQANECYAFTHGNLLALIRRIPGNAAGLRPKWADSPDANMLYPIIFLRQFSAASDMEKQILESITGRNYVDLESNYESFLRMEDSPIKRIDGNYFLVNYEEAWMTLQVDVTDAMSSRMQETIIALLTECRDVDEYSSQPQASIIQRLIFNYIYFRETGSNQTVISSRVNTILELAKIPGCKEVLFKSLSHLAEAAPAETMSFIETELEDGVVFQAFSKDDSWSSSYQNVLWALDKLILFEDTAIRACRVLYNLCNIQREYHTSNSPKDSLLNALCLWSTHTAVPIEAKTRLAIQFIEDDCSFGVPFAIELIAKTSVLTGNRIGEKARKYESITYAEYYSALKVITSAIFNTAIRAKRADWIESTIKSYRYIPCDVLDSSSELVASAEFSPEQKMPIIFQIKSHLYYIRKGDHDDRSQWIESLNKWLDALFSDDPISKEGWRFYKTYHPPFPELLSEPEESFLEREKRALMIREQAFRSMRDEYGIDAVLKLVGCMEDSRLWGDFLGKNLHDDEFLIVASLLCSDKKLQSLAGLVNSVELSRATEIYDSLSPEDQELLLPLLYRDDIGEWLNSPEKEQIYWQNKQLFKFNDRVYRALMKYNPCGLLMLFIQDEKTSESFNRLIDVVQAIVNSGNYSDTGLLTHVVQEYDSLYYSEEWAELCLTMYDKSVFEGSYGYYPVCLSAYFFNHPDKMIERYHADSTAFYGHFHFRYILPNIAYEDFDRFIAWSDYIYEAAKEEPFLISTLGSIMGKSGFGKDGVFPHEYVRIALERYSNNDLTREVAFGWLNSRGARIVQDGLYEKKMELQYRGYSRSMELDYPQTAKLLSIIADDYQREAKSDQLDSELFPQ
ncbi:MAG: hypothetical protein IJI45_04550 [Anaerolineaceae bacterium]|nr:hypothetical protein [Anaerolineaceae bacterium]